MHILTSAAAFTVLGLCCGKPSYCTHNAHPCSGRIYPKSQLTWTRRILSGNDPVSNCENKTVTSLAIWPSRPFLLKCQSFQRLLDIVVLEWKANAFLCAERWVPVKSKLYKRAHFNQYSFFFCLNNHHHHPTTVTALSPYLRYRLLSVTFSFLCHFCVIFSVIVTSTWETSCS